MVGKILNTIQKRPKLVWALLSSASAATSTIVYLWLIHGRSDRNEFLYLYSTIGMWSGWLNTAVCYLAPAHRALRTQTMAILFYLVSVLATVMAPWLLFNLMPTALSVGFSMALLIPVLYINTFSIHFAAGDFKYVYARNLVFNAAYLFAALVAFAFPNHLEGVFKTTTLLLPFGFILWLTDTSRSDRMPAFSQTSPVYLRVLLNPALPIFERLIWDQVVLAKLGFPALTFYIYTVSRVVSFTGTVAMTYFLSHTMENDTTRLPKAWSGVWATFAGLLAVQLVIPSAWQIETTFLSSQLCGWLLSVTFMLHLRDRSNFYNLLLYAWLGDLAARSVGMYFGNITTYSYVAISSSLLIGLVVFFAYSLRKRLSLFEERLSANNSVSTVHEGALVIDLDASR